MRIETRTLDVFGAGPKITELVFSQKEIDQMRAVSKLFDRARQACEDHVGPDWIDSEEDLLLAYAEHGASDIIDAGRVEIGAS